MKNIAILVPSYNAESTLARTLQSILDQGESLARHVDFVMLSDDGSKDSTIALAESLWQHDSVPLHVKRAATNQGEYRNVNSAFAAMPAHIEWLLIMHADNEALPGWLSLLARECDRAGFEIATICGSWQYVVDDVIVGAGDQRGPDYIETVPGTDETLRDSIFKGCWWHNSTAAIRVQAWRSVGGHPQDTPILSPLEMLGIKRPQHPPSLKLRIKGDWDILLRILSSSMAIRYIGTPLIRYHELSSSVSAGSFAWHGDLIETLQVMRRHQAVLSAGDLIRFHLGVSYTLLRRFVGAMLKGDWRRSGLAITAVPYLAASLIAAMLSHERREGGRLKSIPLVSNSTAS